MPLSPEIAALPQLPTHGVVSPYLRFKADEQTLLVSIHRARRKVETIEQDSHDEIMGFFPAPIVTWSAGLAGRVVEVDGLEVTVKNTRGRRRTMTAVALYGADVVLREVGIAAPGHPEIDEIGAAS